MQNIKITRNSYFFLELLIYIDYNEYRIEVRHTNQNISPDQVAQVTQQRQQYSQAMTPEQMQRAQVLNLYDFQETARIEKMSSKKPSTILAFLGITLIALGVFYPTIESMFSKPIDDTDFTTEYRESEDEVVKTVTNELNCTFETLNKSNGTDEIITVKYVFEDDVLKTYTKDYLLRKSLSATETPPELANYLVALEPYLEKKVPGYEISLQQVTDGSITKTTVDYKTLDYSSIPEEYQTNYRFDVPFQSNATINEVRVGLTGQGYICQ